MKDTTEFQNIVDGFRREKRISVKLWEEIHRDYEDDRCKKYSKLLDFDEIFIPRLRMMFGDDIERMKIWLDQPNKNLHGGTPRDIRCQVDGKHCFKRFISRFPRR